MGNETSNNFNSPGGIQIENNPFLGQNEDDFQIAFNQTFKKKQIIQNEQEKCPEMELYYLHNNNVIQKEEPQHLCQKSHFFKSDPNKINLVEDNAIINREQKNISIDEIQIENNSFLGQDEDDFQEAFNEAFPKKDINKCNHEKYQEMGIYNLHNNNVTQKEEPQHICQNNYFNSALNKINICDDSIAIKNIQQKEENNLDEKKHLISEICEKEKKSSEKVEIINLEEGEDEEEEGIINNNEEIKCETNNIVLETCTQNKFRVYNSNEFNIFHPGGNTEFYNRLKEEIDGNLLQIQENENENKTCNTKKFKVEKSKKTKKKVKEKKKRKDKPDDVRKKVKSRFLKSTKNRINEMLKSAKSKEFFNFLPQCFICDISKKKNRPIINMKYKDLMAQNFIKDDDEMDGPNKTMLQKKRKTDKKKFDNNVKVLKYLEKNSDICKKSQFNVIGNMTFKEIFKEYLKSDEFEKEIEILKNENNDEKYIKDYIIKAFGYINYFSSSSS